MTIREKLTSKQARTALKLAAAIIGILTAQEVLPKECGPLSPILNIASEWGGDYAE